MMAPAERRQRALDRGLFLADRVSRVAAATWLVPSQTDPSGAHAVALIDGYLRCDCFASLAGHPCAHGAAVALTMLAGPVRAAQPAGAAEASPRPALRPAVRLSA
jgi:hypothetical protein